jgi:hypothetical protein
LGQEFLFILLFLGAMGGFFINKTMFALIFPLLWRMGEGILSSTKTLFNLTPSFLFFFLLKIIIFSFENVYISTISSFSKAPSNYSNSSSKSTSIPMSSIKLEWDLQSILKSLRQVFC